MTPLANWIMTFAWSSVSSQVSTRSTLAETVRASPNSQNSRSSRCEPTSVSAPPPDWSSLVRQPVGGGASAGGRGRIEYERQTICADVIVPRRPEATISCRRSRTG